MQPYVLLWLRYTAFLLLYPLGVGSELAMVALAMPAIRAQRPLSIKASGSRRGGGVRWGAELLAGAAHAAAHAWFSSSCCFPS